MATPKKKKPSIREFVSEAELKFQLYLLKYTNQVKKLEEKSIEEIEEKWAYDTNKRINRFKKDLDKPQYKDLIPQDAIEFNIKYVENLPAPTDIKYITKNFEKQRKIFLDSLKERIANNETGTLEADKKMVEHVKALELKSTTSKEKFGQMLLLVIKNLATMPSFSGYSDNWKTDFFSNAIEKTLLYLDNFDENLLSKRTGNKSNAFAYVTQICFNAFVNIINIRKKEESFLKDTISLEAANLDGMKNYQNATLSNTKHEAEQPKEYKKTIKSLDELDTVILQGLMYIEKSNERLHLNNCISSEIDELIAETPEDEKTSDFHDYIMDLREKITVDLEDYEINTLKIIKPEGLSLGEWKMPSSELLKDISLIITHKAKKVKKVVEEPEPELVEIDEMEEFDNEW